MSLHPLYTRTRESDSQAFVSSPCPSQSTLLLFCWKNSIVSLPLVLPLPLNPGIISLEHLSSKNLSHPYQVSVILETHPLKFPSYLLGRLRRFVDHQPYFYWYW